MGSYEAKLKATGVAPAGWSFDDKDWWLEEHGLIMEPPGPLPAKSRFMDGKFTEPSKKYVVTGDRQVGHCHETKR